MSSVNSASILAQVSYGTYFENGSVHVIVAKTFPFMLEVVCPIPAQSCRVTASLVYANDLRPVESIKQEPMQSKIYVGGRLDRTTVECRIIPLTSKHDNSLFRVKLTCVAVYDPASSYELLSEPIHTVSKTSQANKLLDQKRGIVRDSTPNSTPNTAPNTLPAEPSPISSVGAKKNSTDLILEALQRLEKRQSEQQRQLDQLMLGSPNSMVGSPFSSPSMPAADDDSSFEDAFQLFMETYSRVPSAERPRKLRKLSSNSHFPEFVSLCSTVSNEIAPLDPLDQLAGVPIDCADCQHKRQLEAWDSLYSQFIADV